MEEIIRDFQSRNISSGSLLVYILDGILALWNLAGVLLAGVSCVVILDIIHVVEYLWEASDKTR